MSYQYRAALTVIRDARKKRGKITLTKKFFDTLRVVNQALPASSFCDTLNMIHPHLAVSDDIISNELLRQHVDREIEQDRVAKTGRRGNGNCLFNSTSVALIGKCSTILQIYKTR